MQVARNRRAIRDNLLLWSHYCDSHRGVALGFERKEGPYRPPADEEAEDSKRQGGGSSPNEVEVKKPSRLRLGFCRGSNDPLPYRKPPGKP